MADDAPPSQAAEAPDRDYPISREARFSIKGKTVDLDRFIADTMGELADREPVEPQPQPPGAPQSVIWNSRRPADWIELSTEDEDQADAGA